MGGKYPLLTPNEIIAVLKQCGFVLKGHRGSHAKYSDGTHIVIIPMHKQVARGTLKSILMQAGLELEEFIARL
jgi:predicted RNA binding protein YcfA (HicA-like mRNA interferase family)